MKQINSLYKEERIPCEPGKSEKVDSVYVRNGVADVFMISEPLAGRRETVVETQDDDTLYANTTMNETVGSGTLTNYDNYTGYGEYKLKSGVSYSKNRIDVKHTYTASGVRMTYAVGSQSSYGIVTIANSNSGSITRTSATSTLPAEANNQVIYQVSAALGVGYSFTGVSGSISINGGASWTQTLYFRVTKNGVWRVVASTYV